MALPNVVTGTLASVASGTAFTPVAGLDGRFVFNLALWGTFTATAVLERSFDAGTTWIPVSGDTAGTASAWTAPMSITLVEIEGGVQYRIRCSARTSGTISYRLSQ